MTTSAAGQRYWPGESPPEISRHTLRQVLFTWLNTQGIDDALIQPCSGHATRQSLKIYSHLARELTRRLGRADVTTAPWEEDGTMTNLEGRVLRRRRVRPPAHGVIDDLTLLALLAGRPGRGRYFSADTREVFDELRRASAGGPPTTRASVIGASTPTTAPSGPALARTTPGPMSVHPPLGQC
jgi:hypothetical protein